ncbi:TPA: hypothetical protein EYP66_16490 [Candidatus Poribacteria bacterium]|nr:hypothetical protein [Candidatus Poribacteria bacterium]
MDNIYISAAKVIRKHGCYVVFGGWACCNPLEDFYYVLNYHDAYSDKYKVFWYQMEEDERCFVKGPPFGLTTLGRYVLTFANLFPEEILAFDEFQTTPKLTFEIREEEDSIEGFTCGKNIVFVVHLSEERYQAQISFGIDFELYDLKEKVRKIERFSVEGEAKNVNFVQDGTYLRFRVPFSDLTPQRIKEVRKMLLFYVSVETYK